MACFPISRKASQPEAGPLANTNQTDIGDSLGSRVLFQRVGVQMASGGDVENIDFLDRASQSILRLLQKAGDATDQDRRHALEMAQRLSQELRAARDRVAQLEDDLADYGDRAERAELWLDKIRTEIEQQFPRGGSHAPRWKPPCPERL
jgi:hypothetical protein